MIDESIEGALRVIQELEKLNIPYYVGGSIASSTYGTHRSTLDADLIADLQEEHIDLLVAALQAEFHIDAEMIQDAIHQRSSFNLLGYHIFTKIDVFIPKRRPYDQMVFERRLRATVDEETPRMAYIASPEDTVLAKLEWYEMGHRVSERQWGDILGVLKVQHGRLDAAYLRHWAAELKVSELLEQALSESDRMVG
jgi:hypothetical protein